MRQASALPSSSTSRRIGSFSGVTSRARVDPDRTRMGHLGGRPIPRFTEGGSGTPPGCHAHRASGGRNGGSRTSASVAETTSAARSTPRGGSGEGAADRRSRDPAEVRRTRHMRPKPLLPVESGRIDRFRRDGDREQQRLCASLEDHGGCSRGWQERVCDDVRLQGPRVAARSSPRPCRLLPFLLLYP